MSLSLRVHGTFNPGTGEKPRPIVYDVAGMPQGQTAVLGRRSDGRWIVTRIWRKGTYTFAGEFETPLAALKALQSALDQERREAMDRASAREMNWYGG